MLVLNPLWEVQPGWSKSGAPTRWNQFIWNLVIWLLACIIGVLFTFLAGPLGPSIVLGSTVWFCYVLLARRDVSQETILQTIVGEVIVIAYLLYLVIGFLFMLR
jgi:hypothetical protein